MSVLINHATFLHHFLAIDGWFFSPDDPLTSVRLRNIDHVVLKAAIDPPRLEADGTFNGQHHFTFHGYLSCVARPQDVQVVFTTAAGREFMTSVENMVAVRRADARCDALYARFKDAVGCAGAPTLLDVGGRDRSGVDRSSHFRHATTTVFDINPSDNVDVVGDAHEMSRYLPADHYDFVQSISVFEHLAQPWVVVEEINKVMKPGGLLFVASHQTVGMHDVPWDFWRFSDQAYRSLFSVEAGFEVLGTEMQEPAFIVPHWYMHSMHSQHEAAVGFMSTAVLVRKTSRSQSVATKTLSGVMQTPYPG